VRTICSPAPTGALFLWKHAKYFWRRFAAVHRADLLDEVQSLMKGFGSEFTINFAWLLSYSEGNSRVHSD
jgi:hypothetical protein